MGSNYRTEVQGRYVRQSCHRRMCLGSTGWCSHVSCCYFRNSSPLGRRRRASDQIRSHRTTNCVRSLKVETTADTSPSTFFVSFTNDRKSERANERMNEKRSSQCKVCEKEKPTSASTHTRTTKCTHALTVRCCTKEMSLHPTSRAHVCLWRRRRTMKSSSLDLVRLFCFRVLRM